MASGEGKMGKMHQVLNIYYFSNLGNNPGGQGKQRSGQLMKSAHTLKEWYFPASVHSGRSEVRPGFSLV